MIAAATQASGSSRNAVNRPRSSARRPVTIGPGASPIRLFARVRAANAEPWMAIGVRLATIAPDGPVVPATRNIATPRSASCAGPCGKLQCQRQRQRAAQAVADRELDLALGPTARQPVADHAAQDHARLRRSAGTAPWPARRGPRAGQGIIAIEEARQPGRQGAGGEQLQTAADIGEPHRSAGEQLPQRLAAPRGRAAASSFPRPVSAPIRRSRTTIG